jgi:hypothetical protein
MKYLQSFSVFESQTSGTLTPEQKAFLDQYTKKTLYTEGTWSVNPTTGLVDVQGGFHCSGLKLKSLCGIQFGTVKGHFFCQDNQLTSLEGAPQTVAGEFLCSSNQLTTLVGAPKTVGMGFECNLNQLTTLEGAPETVGGDFFCSRNQLTSLVGAPQTVKGIFNCDTFALGTGKWNPTGWLEVLLTGSPEAQKLIQTIIGADYWNSEISSNPIGTLFRLATLWDRLPEDMKGGIKIPSNLQDDFDNFLDLERAGVY